MSKNIDFYVDCSNIHTPLEHAEFMDWFEHSYLMGDGTDPMEKNAFLARFPIEEEHLKETKDMAAKLRSNNESSFQRGVVRVVDGGMQTPGIKERLVQDTNDFLFFPKRDSDTSTLYNVELLKVPSSTGHGVRDIASVSLAKTYSARIFDIRVPARFVEWAEEQLKWNETFTSNKEYVLQRHLFLIYSINIPWIGFNPVIFYNPPTLPPISYNFFRPFGDRTGLPPFVSEHGAMFNSTLLLALVRHETVPYMDSNAVNAHHALIGLLVQADIGWEKHAVQLREGEVPRIPALQDAMNVVILFLSDKDKKHDILQNALKNIFVRIMSDPLIALLDVIYRNPIGKLDQKKLKEKKDFVFAFDPKNMKALGNLLFCETMFPEWRILASIVWGVNVNTLYCQNLFLLLFLRIHMRSQAAFDESEKERERWKTMFPDFEKAIFLRLNHLEACINDAREQANQLIQRYDPAAKSDAEIMALTNKRKILRDSFFNIERMMQQQDELRMYALKVGQIVNGTIVLFNSSQTDKIREAIREAIRNEKQPESVRNPLIEPSLLQSQYTTFDLNDAELENLHLFKFTEMMIFSLLKDT